MILRSLVLPNHGFEITSRDRSSILTRTDFCKAELIAAQRESLSHPRENRLTRRVISGSSVAAKTRCIGLSHDLRLFPIKTFRNRHRSDTGGALAAFRLPDG